MVLLEVLLLRASLPVQLLAAEQFTGPNTQQIANQQKQQEQQQQQQLARQIGQGSVDDIDTSVDVPTDPVRLNDGNFIFFA